MKRSRKFPSLLNFIRDVDHLVRETFVTRPTAWFALARSRIRNLPQTNFDLGCQFAEEQKWFDAAFRFRMALYFQPEFPKALYNLSCCYYHLGKRDKAQAGLRKVLTQTPDDDEALFMFAVVDGASLNPAHHPHIVPRSIVMQFFTPRATREAENEIDAGYQGGTATAEALKDLLPNRPLKIIDLACGVGLAAWPFLPRSEQILGVDITRTMISEALSVLSQGKRLFDQVVEGDITKPIKHLPLNDADLILMINASPFIGNLAGVFENAFALLNPEGVFALTLTGSEQVADFALNPETGRFVHSAASVKALAKTHGLETLKHTKLAIYPDTTSELLVFCKGNPA